MKIIYGYKKKDENKFVYIGQTGRPRIRRYEHEVLEAFTKEREEYNYPLSRAIRKYGIEAFEYCILEENIPNDEINERERYWIKHYNTFFNGYNQNPGGNARIEITEDDVKEIYEMLRDGFTYKEISKRKNICAATISVINNGLAYKIEGEKYPIVDKKYGKRLPEEIVDEIITLLIDKEIKVRDIANLYNVGFNVVVRINQGQSYRRDGLEYPLRKGRVRENKNSDYNELIRKVNEKLND